MQLQINDSSEERTSRLSACICNGRVYQAPDESGGYRMTDGIACFSQYPNIPNTQQKDKITPVAIAQLAIEHNCECGSDFFSELSKNFKDAFT